MRKPLVLAPSFQYRLIEYAQQAAPLECCGVLGGRGAVATSVYPLTNDRQSAQEFFADPQELFHVVRMMRKNKEEMIGIYHSHPTSAPLPSPSDREKNYYPECYYLIISLLSEEPEMRCFVWDEDGEFSGIHIV